METERRDDKAKEESKNEGQNLKINKIFKIKLLQTASHIISSEKEKMPLVKTVGVSLSKQHCGLDTLKNLPAAKH